MAHPIIEALYIGLLTSGLSQPVDAPKTVRSPPSPPPSIQLPMRQRIVYDWAAGERRVFNHGLVGRAVADKPMVGMSDAQVERIVVGSNS